MITMRSSAERSETRIGATLQLAALADIQTTVRLSWKQV